MLLIMSALIISHCWIRDASVAPRKQHEHHCRKLWRFVRGNVRAQVRAAATMGGNLVLAKEQGLQSDVATLMSALQAQVGITSVDKEDLRYVGPNATAALAFILQ